MKLIGLTGNSGSGKGYVASLFASRGIDSIDTDAIVHRLYREDADCIAALEEAFGPLQDADGAIDRRRLAAIVFDAPAKLERLNAIVHAFVKREVETICRRYAEAGAPLLLLDAPQLYEAGMEQICYRVIAVTAPEELRLERVTARDGISRAAALERFRNQHSAAFFAERADYLVENDGRSPIEAQIDRIIGEVK